MPASPIVREVHNEHLAYFGEPDESIVFDSPPPLDDSFPDRMDVFIWQPTEDCDVTTFATIGMADRPMQGAEHRAELHLGIRAVLDAAQRKKVARFMANVAMYPFYHRTHLDWWHRLRDPGVIPEFPSCSTLFFHPKFVEDGWDTINTEEGVVKLLNIIPTLQAEYDLGSAQKMVEYLAEHEVDLLAPR